MHVTEVEHDSYDTFEEQTYSLTYIRFETAVTRRLGNGTTSRPSNPTSLLGTWVSYNRAQEVYVKNVPERCAGVHS
jgi:hypothetical protein